MDHRTLNGFECIGLTKLHMEAPSPANVRALLCTRPRLAAAPTDVLALVVDFGGSFLLTRLGIFTAIERAMRGGVHPDENRDPVIRTEQLHVASVLRGDAQSGAFYTMRASSGFIQKGVDKHHFIGGQWFSHQLHGGMALCPTHVEFTARRNPDVFWWLEGSVDGVTWLRLFEFRVGDGARDICAEAVLRCGRFYSHFRLLQLAPWRRDVPGFFIGRFDLRGYLQ